MLKDHLTPPLEEEHRILLEDLAELNELLITFLRKLDPAAWHQPAPDGTWTLQQTVAHLVAAAEWYYLALEHTLQQQAFKTPGFQVRQDLPDYNRQQILLRQYSTPEELLVALQDALSSTLALAHQMTPEQYAWPVVIPVFNRILTLGELLETQATHPGLVHGAQIALPYGQEPLWSRYSASFLHRMLERFFRLMSLTYWPERGKGLQATLQFKIGGAAGGDWYVQVSPTGTQAGSGKGNRVRLTLWAASADVFLRIATDSLTLRQALFTGKLFAYGQLLPIAPRILSLFSPT